MIQIDCPKYKPMSKSHKDSLISLINWGNELSWFKDFENEYLKISFVDIGDDKMEGTVIALMIDFIKPISIIFHTKVPHTYLSRHTGRYSTYIEDLNTQEIMNLKAQFVHDAKDIIMCSFYEVE